ncbi:thioredoxin [Vibrio coralliilyticus]|jgi:predicted DsbA family dithiol-disulfide isomerase|uniref:Thioredoxin n=1 Tax=Vibrio coralliilyticus TaxID=190893 RepID=A0A837G3Z1_9VIBR|nr:MULTISPECIES: DsbA family protein [Vibrio]KJY70141.1 thioredoxin [Vibrio coralliilyticus]MCC2520702.1 DsbA family protein [Vibrio coralliilyticus]MCM5508003.1 DsbA family protein [Vibrio sp. SCSIO 43169]MDE3897553.1 DsbA family protein [Vibrio sp. CC007]NRF24183.1 DsbA family protein [Vibrio coralliilyticus]
MKKQIQIYTDYVCPYCLLADHVINKVIQGLDVEIKWRPFELRPAPVPTLRTEDRYLPEIWERSVYPMAAKLGVALKLPEISPQPRTDKAFQVFALAEQVGLGDEFSVAVMKAFFQQERDIGEPDVLADIASQIGMERDEVLEALSNGTYLEHHQTALKHAVEEARISSVPTIYVGSRKFSGVPDPTELRLAIEALDEIQA